MATPAVSLQSEQPANNGKRLTRWLFLLSGVALLLWLGSQIAELDNFSEEWNLGIRDVLNDFKRWVVVNRRTHWMFLFFFEPLSAVVDFALRRVEDLLLWLPWPAVIILFFFIGERIKGLGLALLTTACLLPMGLFGLWEESMETLALMVMAVLIALAIGIPVGIWAARNERVERILRPILDGMQTMPAFVYLIPVLLFFGIARVPSVIATIIYALPPIIRLTTLGIRSVSSDVLEAAEAFGSTEKQLLRKVQFPLALPTILVGVNQTIMMALSIVVIASLIGAGGLGDVVLKALRRIAVGEALEGGLAIVLLAVLLDRLSAALTQIEQQSLQRFQGFRLFGEGLRGNQLVERLEALIERGYIWSRATADKMIVQMKRVGWMTGRLTTQPLADWLLALLLILLFSLILRLAGLGDFPSWLRVDIRGPVDTLVEWMQINLYDIGGSGIGTGPFRDFLIIRIFRPLQFFFAEQLPWPVIAFVFAFLAYQAGGWRLTVTVLLLTVLIGVMGMWPSAMDTLAQSLVAVFLCVLAGIPLGIWAAHNDRVEIWIRPMLDFLQTVPIFVYLVPVIMLFGSGSVAGLIAALLYSFVPVVRLTNAGIRNVDKTLHESATAFGSTFWQILFKVEIPLAFPSILLGINQTIMMVLAMVIIAGLVGATGLGLEVYHGFANDNLGRSVEAGLAIVLLAIIIDRISQQLAQQAAKAANVGQAEG